MAKRYQFNRMHAEDLDFFLSVRNECADCLHNNKIFTIDECHRWFLNTSPEFYIITYEMKPIGYFRLSTSENGEQYIGADLDQSYRGQGHGYRAYREFIRFFDETQHEDNLYLEVISFNEVAIHLYHKLGFVEIERNINSVYRFAKYWDNIKMKLFTGGDFGGM